MKVYVANASPQRHEFIYRMAEQKRERRQPIEPMSQILLSDDFTQGQIDDLIAQSDKYGFPSVADIRNGAPRKRFTRLCYSIDAPISSLMIDALLRSNVAALDEFGKELREETAVASNQAVLRELDLQKRASGLEANVRQFEQTVQEEEPSRGYDRPETEIVHDGFRIDPKAPPHRKRA
jgi:hypothetical protein